MSILEELWYGNVYPADHPIRKDREYAIARSKDRRNLTKPCPV